MGLKLAGNDQVSGNRPLVIWAVSDGRAGIESQVMGLAEAVARLAPAQIVTKRLRFRPLLDRLPTALKLWPDAMLTPDSDRIGPPWPDLWIAAGRATLPFSLRMARRSQGRSFVVQLQHPRTRLDAFDLVIAPEHDDLSGPNVLSLTGSTNRITRDRLADSSAPWEAQIETLSRPRLAVLIGGKSKTHDLSAARAEAICDQIESAIGAGSLLLTLSRRTPDAAREVFRRRLGHLPGIIYDGEGDNPYFAFLLFADHILVTEDSVNMTAEAAVTGKPVFRLAVDPLRPPGKFVRFHQALERRGIVRPFEGQLDHWLYEPLNETERAAQHLLQVFNEKHRRRIVNR